MCKGGRTPLDNIIAILGGSRSFRKRKDAPLRNSSRSLGWLCLPDSLPFSKPKFNWLFHLQLATNLPKTYKYVNKFIFFVQIICTIDYFVVPSTYYP